MWGHTCFIMIIMIVIMIKINGFSVNIWIWIFDWISIADWLMKTVFKSFFQKSLIFNFTMFFLKNRIVRAKIELSENSFYFKFNSNIDGKPIHFNSENMHSSAKVPRFFALDIYIKKHPKTLYMVLCVFAHILMYKK